MRSLKYLRYSTLGCQDIGIRIFEFVAKTQFLCVEMMKTLGGDELSQGDDLMHDTGIDLTYR